MSKAIERLQAANILDAVPDELREVFEGLSDAEVDALISVSGKVSDAAEVAGFQIQRPGIQRPGVEAPGVSARPGARPGGAGRPEIATDVGGLIF